MDFPKPEYVRRLIMRVQDAMRRSPERLTLVGSAAAAMVIFAIDLALPDEVRLHGLYLFPLAFVARYCARLRWAAAMLVLTTVLQFISYSTQSVAVPSLISDVAVPCASSVLIVFLARSWRMSFLTIARQATIDSLTGLSNRRAFFAELDAEISRQKRDAGSFALAMLDLDGFKALNDSRGHRTGDEALRLVADTLRTCTRASDSLGRIGGDEFGILIPHAERDCTSMLRDLCVTIASATAAAGCPLTTSIGCKTFRSPPDDAADALQQADRIMYEAKMRGKNRAEHVAPDYRAA
jgi:diguanylate cyclase (GGDEF)-like protein